MNVAQAICVMQLVWLWRQHWQAPGVMFINTLCTFTNIPACSIVIFDHQDPNIARLPLVRVTAVDGGEPEIEVTNDLPHYFQTKTSLLRSMMILGPLEGLMWQEHPCLSLSLGPEAPKWDHFQDFHFVHPPCSFDPCPTFVFGRIGNHCIVDSSPEEESCSSASLVVAVSPDGSISTLRKVGLWWPFPRHLIISVHKSTSLNSCVHKVGGGSFHPSTLISATQMAVTVGEEVLRRHNYPDHILTPSMHSGG